MLAGTASLDEGRRNVNSPLRDAWALMISPVAALWGGETSRESGANNGIDNANRPTNALGGSGVSGVVGIAKGSGIDGVENAAQKSDFSARKSGRSKQPQVDASCFTTKASRTAPRGTSKR